MRLRLQGNESCRAGAASHEQGVCTTVLNDYSMIPHGATVHMTSTHILGLINVQVQPGRNARSLMVSELRNSPPKDAPDNSLYTLFGRNRFGLKNHDAWYGKVTTHKLPTYKEYISHMGTRRLVRYREKLQNSSGCRPHANIIDRTQQ